MLKKMLTVVTIAAALLAPMVPAQASVFYSHPHWSNGIAVGDNYPGDKSLVYVNVYNQIGSSYDSILATAISRWNGLPGSYGSSEQMIQFYLITAAYAGPDKCSSPVTNWSSPGIVICGAVLPAGFADAEIYGSGATSWISCTANLYDPCGAGDLGGHIERGKIRVDTPEVASTSTAYRKMLLTHELGHALGFDHGGCGAGSQTLCQGTNDMNGSHSVMNGTQGGCNLGSVCQDMNYGLPSVYDWSNEAWLYSKAGGGIHGYCLNSGICYSF